MKQSPDKITVQCPFPGCVHQVTVPHGYDSHRTGDTVKSLEWGGWHYNETDGNWYCGEHSE